jgi:hypothetical protein
MWKEEGKGIYSFLILYFHCGVAKDRGEHERVFLKNMLKGDGREFFFYVEKG